MDYESFKDCVVLNLQQQLRGVEVRVKKVRKNNGIELDSLVIYEADIVITPCINWNHYYKQFQQGLSVQNITTEMCTKYKEFKENSESMKNNNYVGYFDDFTTASKHIVFKIVNFEKNKRLLENVPFSRILDLAIVYMFMAKEEEDSVGTILIKNEYLQMWNITVNELHEYAMLNTPRLMPVNLKSMEEVISSMIGTVSLSEEDTYQCHNTMFVLSNAQGNHGASTMIYPNLMKQFVSSLSNKPEKVVILPSSIHETILLPVYTYVDVLQLKQMVRDINETQVAREEVLSNTVYYYSVEDDAIKILEEDTSNAEK